MKIKRILAGGMAALATGATLAFGTFAAGLGDYVTTSGNTLTSPIIAIGNPSSPSSEFALDVVGAVDIGAAVVGYATTTVPVSGAAASVGVSGGVDLATTTTKLYMGSLMNQAKSTITSQDLPDVLASGTTIVSGVSYKYDQYINLGARQVKFDKANAELTDPAVYVDIGTSDSAPAYNTTIVFNKALNISSSSVQGKKLTLFGSDYTIGSTSRIFTGGAANNKLELFGYGSSLLLEGGAGSQTVNIAAVDHEVELSFVTSDGQAYVIVDGEGDSFTAGQSGVLSGVNIYMKNVWPISNTLGRAEISFGSSKITLQHGTEVKYGESDTAVDNTLVYLTGDNTGISTLVVSIAADDSSRGFATKDQAFADPVWGTFKLAFNGMVPEPMAAARDTITVDNSGTTSATVKMTDYRGNEKTMTFAYTGTSFNPGLNETSARQYHVAEGEAVKKNDYFLLAPTQESEFSHLYQLSGMSSIGTTSSTIQLSDVFTGDSTTVFLTDTVGGNAYAGKDFYIDGQTYHVAAVAPTNNTMTFFWGAGAGQTGVGNKQMVFPLVKLKGGEYFTFVTQAVPSDAAVVVNTTELFEVPGGDLNVSYYYNGATTIVYVGGTTNTTTWYQTATIGQIEYNVTFSQLVGAVTITAIKPSNTYYSSTANSNYVGVMIYEEENNASVENAIILSISKDTSDYMTAAAPKFTGTSWSDTLGSDTSVTHYANEFGSYASYDSDSQGVIKVYYPNTQAVATAAIGKDPAFSVSAGGTGTVESAVKITNPVAKLASEVSTSALSADLILIGGPCANTLVAQLLGSDEQCDNWPHSEGIIKEVSDAFSSGQKALIVAGTLATDTRALSAKVMKGTLSYEA